MQYPYERNFESFEEEVRARLDAIERRLTDVAGFQGVMQEMVKAMLNTHAPPPHMQPNNGYPSSFTGTGMGSQVQRKPFFNVSIVGDDRGDPVVFRVAGRTFDYRDQLKSFGNAVFHKESKSWEFQYVPEVYESVTGFLRTLTDEVNIV